MGKTKSAKPDMAVKSSKDSQVKKLSSVKEGAITKPSQTSKSKSKDLAKQVVGKADKADKKSKKAKKEPTPEPVSESESDEEDDVEDDSEESASSQSSDAESEEATPAAKKAGKTNGVKLNGIANAAPKVEEASDSSESSDDEATAPKSAPMTTAKAVAGAKADSGSDEDSEGSDAEGDEDSDLEDTKGAKVHGAVDAKQLNGKLEKVASKEGSDEDGSDSEGTSSGTSEASSDEESEEEEAPPKKRKAEADATQVTKKAKIDPSIDDSAKKNLFVGHLSFNVDEEWLTREFESFGELSRVAVITDRESGRSKGFGYVEFVNAADGVKAQAAMHEKEIDGRAVNVDFSKPKDKGAPRQDRQKSYGDNISTPSDTLFVANLPFEVDEDVIAEEFGKHGQVQGVRLPTDMNSGAPKGFGYVQYGSVEEAQEAFGKMTGAQIMGRPIRLDYSTPRPPRDGDSPRGRGGRGGGRGGFDRGGRGGGRGRGGFDRGGGRGGSRGGRGGSTNRGGFGDFKGQKKTF